MSPGAIAGAACFFGLVLFCWLYFFRHDIRRWWQERGPRRQLARELAEEKERELQRLRDELAAKYLAEGGAKPPASGS